MTAPTGLIDSHAHVDAPQFDGDRAAVLERARAAGLEAIILVGAAGDLATAQRTVELAESAPDLYATVGVHPHEACKRDDSWWPALCELARRDSVVAVGESGLDYHYDLSPRAVQQQCFAEHIALAHRVGKPLICHIREAHDDARRLLTEAGTPPAGGVIHCFTGTPKDAARYVDMGFHISFSGIVTFKGASAAPVREAARAVPLHRILVETDCPYLAPVPMRGKRNEPAYVVHTAAAVAAERGIPLAELAEATVANTRSLFALT